MKKLTLYLICTAFGCNASAQNFQAIQDNGYRIYDFGSHRGIDVDSTAAADGDSIFYLTRSVQEQNGEDGCYTPYGPSWMGSHVRISSNGTHLFFNLQGDTIRLEAQAPLGTSWIAYQSPSLTVVCEVVSIEETEIFEGLTDLVKTISFQALDADLNPIDHNVNLLEIKLSENFGFAKTVNFVAFPSGGEAYYEVGLSVLNLVGIEGVTGGVQNLLYREVFDFQAGDELHIRDYNTSFGEGQESRTIIQYLTRTDFPDSIVYSVQVARDYYDTELGGNLVHTGFLSEVQSQVIKASPSFDQLSMSPAIGQFGDANYYVQSNASQREKSISGWYELYLDGNNCWYAEIDGGCSSFDPAPSVYIEKRGGPYYHCGSNFISSGRELVYFNVDGQEGGTPFQLILNAEAAVENEFRVYPNPAIDKVSIEIGEAIPNARIEISDIQGRIVLAERLTGSRSEIEVGTLPAGVFIYRIYADEAVMTTGKILVQR